MVGWVDGFEGNSLSRKWQATRVSVGGQNDGVWAREVRNSKLYFGGVNAGTEAGYWGEWLSLPVNATGDIIISAQVRQKWSAGAGVSSRIGIGVNNAPASGSIRNGLELITNNGFNYKSGIIALAATPFPGMPAMNQQGPLPADIISDFRLVRKNGYLFLYHGGLYVGHAVFAAAITSVDIVATWNAGITGVEKWVYPFNVWPRSVVL